MSVCLRLRIREGPNGLWMLHCPQNLLADRASAPELPTLWGMTEPQRIRSPKDVLTLLPEILEHDYIESLLLLPIRSGSGGAVLRFDLPSRDLVPVLGEQWANEVVGRLCAIDGVDGVILVVHTDAPFTGAGVPPYTTLEASLVEKLSNAGITVRSSICRAGNGWGEFACDDEHCSGYGPRPLSEIESTGKAALSIVTPAGILEALIGSAPPDRRRAVAERLKRIRRDEHLARRAARSWLERCGRPSVRRRSPPVETVALACAAIEDREVRHALIGAALFGLTDPDEAVHALEGTCLELFGGPGEIRDPFSSEPTGQVPGDEAPQGCAGVTRNRLEGSAELARHVLRAAPAHLVGPALVLLAMLEWARGRSSVAREAAGRALAADAGDPLAELVVWLTNTGTLPSWLRSLDSPRADMERSGARATGEQAA